MFYVKPIVMVYQEYAKLSVATQRTTLYSLVTGPCYHIVDANKNESDAYVGTIDSKGMPETAFPTLKYGAKIVKSSPVFKFKNGIVTMNDVPITGVQVSKNVLTFTTYPSSEGMLLNDLIRILDPTDKVVGDGFRIIALDETNKKIYMDRSIDPDMPDAKIIFMREVKDKDSSPWGTDNPFSQTKEEESRVLRFSPNVKIRFTIPVIKTPLI